MRQRQTVELIAMLDVAMGAERVEYGVDFLFLHRIARIVGGHQHLPHVVGWRPAFAIVREGMR